MELPGAAFLVVGATGGFGSRIARALHRRGAELVLSGRDDERLDALAAELDAAAVRADLRDPGAPERIVGEAREAMGRLDGVVYAAGVVAFGPVEALADADLAELLDLNLVAPIRVTREALRALEGGGIVINVSAIVAERPTAGMAAYSAAKAGLSAFDVAAGREARRLGVRILDARPPHMETGLAGRPIAGVAPALTPGRDPDEAAERVVDAIVAGAHEVDWGVREVAR
jgi:short-subunit dehydrogenase